MSDWDRFNDQFRETPWERAERQKAARLAKPCRALGHSRTPKGGFIICERCGITLEKVDRP